MSGCECNADVSSSSAQCVVSSDLLNLHAEIVSIVHGRNAQLDHQLLGVAVREGLLANLRARRYEEELRHAPFRSLTKRESAVLNHLAEGASPEEIARVSFVSLNTVRTQIRAVLTKLGVNSVVAAVAAAYRTGWLSPVD